MINVLEFWLILALFLAMWVISILVITLLHYKRALDWYAVKHGDKEPIENTSIKTRENVNIYFWSLLSAVFDNVAFTGKKISLLKGLAIRQLVLYKILSNYEER